MREMIKPSKKSIKNAISTTKKPFFTQNAPNTPLAQKNSSENMVWRSFASLKLSVSRVKLRNKMILRPKIVMTSSSFCAKSSLFRAV